MPVKYYTRLLSTFKVWKLPDQYVKSYYDQNMEVRSPWLQIHYNHLFSDHFSKVYIFKIHVLIIKYDKAIYLKWNNNFRGPK